MQKWWDRYRGKSNHVKEKVEFLQEVSREFITEIQCWHLSRNSVIKNKDHTVTVSHTMFCICMNTWCCSVNLQSNVISVSVESPHVFHYYPTWRGSWCHAQLQRHRSHSVHILSAERRSDEGFPSAAPVVRGPASPSHLGRYKEEVKYKRYLCDKDLLLGVCWLSLSLNQVVIASL